jgi:hypothetical protein
MVNIAKELVQRDDLHLIFVTHEHARSWIEQEKTLVESSRFEFRGIPVSLFGETEKEQLEWRMRLVLQVLVLKMLYSGGRQILSSK